MREKKIYRVTILGGIVNMLLLCFKFVAGVLGHSAAMIADAVHSMSDFLTDIIVLLFVKISSKPQDDDHDYGHCKYETLATAIIGISLLGVGALLGWKGIQRIIDAINGEVLESPGIIALVAALLSIVLKEWIFRVTRKVAKEVDSQALEANAWHHRSDALSSIGTAVGIGGAVLLGQKWAVLDPVAAVIVSIFIIITALKLIRESIGELMEESLPESAEEEIKKITLAEDTVCDLHNLRTRRIGKRIAIEMHIRMPAQMPLKEAHDHASNIEERLRECFGEDTHITLHLEPVKEKNNEDTTL